MIRVILVLSLICLTACNLATDTENPTPITSNPTTEPTAIPTEDINFAPLSAECDSLYVRVITITDNACAGLSRNQVCFGNPTIISELDENTNQSVFQEAGDQVAIEAISALRLSQMDVLNQTWGIALMRVQATVVETPQQTDVTFVLHGTVALENQGSNAFYIETGIDDAPCATVPQSGILIQTPSGAGKIDFLINEVAIRVGSTIFIQAQPDNEMIVRVAEGQAQVTALGVTQTIVGGYETRVGLDANGLPQTSPLAPEPYDLSVILELPYELLSEAITPVDLFAPTSMPTLIATNTATPTQRSRATTTPRPIITRTPTQTATPFPLSFSTQVFVPVFIPTNTPITID